MQSPEESSFEVKEGQSSPQTKEDVQEVPDKGAVAWMTVAGAWLILFSTLGYVYSFGVYQDFYTRIYLPERTPSTIGWIGSFQLMMPFALGILSGKLFDEGYFHAVEIFGSLVFIFSLFMLSLLKPHQYTLVFICQGLGLGIGSGLTFVPTLGVLSHHFRRHRSLASGIALSGNALGAVVFPISFARGVRATAYVVLGCLVVGNGLMRTRLPPRRLQNPSMPKPDIKTFFLDVPYVLTTLSALFGLFGLFFPVVFLQLYAILHFINPTLSFYSLAIVNGASAVGRILGNHFADKYGPTTILIPCATLTGATIWSVIGIHNATTLIAVSVLYGFFSGATLSLVVALLSSLAKTPSEVGARVGLALAVASFGCLGSAPAQGALLSNSFTWLPPVAFSAILQFVGAGFIVVTRVLLVKRHGSQCV